MNRRDPTSTRAPETRRTRDSAHPCFPNWSCTPCSGSGPAYWPKPATATESAPVQPDNHSAGPRVLLTVVRRRGVPFMSRIQCAEARRRSPAQPCSPVKASLIL